jgi:peroxiredoxin
MLQIGDTAPDFALPGAAAGDIDTHSLTEYTDREWTVILTFYPFDFHPGCTSHWCSLRDADWLTLMDGVVVLGVSTDSVFCHRAFAHEQNLQFTLLSDHDGRVSEAYGVLLEEFEDHPRVARTTVFVVEPDRSIGYVWSGEGIESGPDLDALRTAAGDDASVSETSG